MHMPRTAGRTALGLALALVAGCGGASPQPVEPRPSASTGGAGKALRSWSYTYVSEEFGNDNRITDIAVVSPKDAWALSWSPSARSSLLRYDGKTWRPYELPGGIAEAIGGQMQNLSLTAVGTGDVWLSGSAESGRPFAARFDATGWHAVPLPARGPGVGNVTVLGPDSVWVLGSDDAVWHLEGRNWTRTVLPFRAPGLVADPTGTDVWAVGTDRKTGAEPPPHEDAPDSRQPASARWDGTRWHRVPIPTELTLSDGHDFSASVTSTTVLADGRAWMTGMSGDEPEPIEDGDYYPADEVPFTLFFDGTRWRAPSNGEHPPAAVLSATRMRDAAGRTHRIGRPPYAPGVSGKVTGADRRQKLLLDEITPVPGTDEVWAAGRIELGAQGYADFTRAVVVRYRLVG
ncbi:hypothetical protein AB0F07_21655 [Streptomyces fructofermentans]|uniref:hypothetical protein n=1 Tax=Streptomyces fructofermentans TaxID=152141 RepID=UPI0033D4C4BF